MAPDRFVRSLQGATLLPFAAAVFIGAFLLFQVQPLTGKYILPWFGGGPGVWSACLLFFQLGLLGGYAYAHWLSTYLRPGKQLAVHAVVILGALVCLPIIPSGAWKPTGTENPSLAILCLLAVTVGVPYLALAGTGPLLQAWLSRLRPNTQVYRLYALSNTASMLALLSYPFFFETRFSRQHQAWLWSVGFGIYSVFCLWCAYKFFRHSSTVAAPDSPREDPITGTLPATPSILVKSLWLLLPACGSILLVATTNKLCQDVAVVPFLWIVPLAVYLLSFIIAFDSPRWYARLPFTLLLVGALAALCWLLRQGADLALTWYVVICCFALFVCCTVCHGEVYRLRPAPAFLTRFYLAIAAGGALGGGFVALGAPLLFNSVIELHIGMFLCAGLFLAACMLPNRSNLLAVQEPKTWLWLAWLLPLCVIGGVDFYLHTVGKDLQGTARLGVICLRIGIWVVLLLVAAAWFVRGGHRVRRDWRLVGCVWLLVGWGALGYLLWRQASMRNPDMIYRSRNFYGVVTVYQHRRHEPLCENMLLQHGGITHGLQLLDPEQQTWPITYYSEESGIGKAFRVLPQHARRIGVVGLGTGTITAYGRIGDYFRIYEIDPAVEHVAHKHFTYLAHCPAQVEIVPGDARLSLERELPQEFDLLVLDAFSSDAIPVHLLTREAFQVYERHLRADGIIAVHISNHYLDLQPVVAMLAKEFRFHDVLVDFEEDEDQWWNYACTWVLLTRSQEILNQPAIRNVLRDTDYPRKPAKPVPLWTDDFTSLYQILK